MQKNEPISLLNLALSDDFNFLQKCPKEDKENNGVYNYVYSIQAANYAGAKEKPSDLIKWLGFNVIKSQASAIYERIIFRSTNKVDNLPRYITRLPDDYKFEDEIADEIDNNPMLSVKPHKVIKYMHIAEE